MSQQIPGDIKKVLFKQLLKDMNGNNIRKIGRNLL